MPKVRLLRSHAAGFTLLELLVAATVTMLLVVILASVSDRVAAIWSRNENKSDIRETARTAAALIGREMRQAVLPLYMDEQDGLQWMINPVAGGPYGSIFWQAPIATSHTQGDLAMVGYFIRKDEGRYKLCRLFVNPDDPGYDLTTWLDDRSLLDEKAPATEASDLKGLFLENVARMWVTAYDETHTAYADYDSRLVKKLPSHVQVSLAILDKVGADRVAGGLTLPETAATPEAFLSSLDDKLFPHVEMVSIHVAFPRTP